MRKNVFLFGIAALFGALHADSHFCPLGPSHARAFSVLPQLVLPKEAVRLEKVSSQSCEVDLSLAPTFGLVLFKRSGTYKIVWHGQTRSPLSLSWSLGFSLDGLVLFSNQYGTLGCHNHPQKFEGSVVLSVNAGQTLRLVNSSAHPIELVPIRSDSKAAFPSFVLKIDRYGPC